jgi:hypothetical protein
MKGLVLMAAAVAATAATATSAGSALRAGSPITLHQARAAFTAHGYRVLPNLFSNHQPAWRLGSDELVGRGQTPGVHNGILRTYLNVYWARRDTAAANKQFIPSPYTYRIANVVLILDPTEPFAQRRRSLAAFSTLGRGQRVGA